MPVNVSVKESQWAKVQENLTTENETPQRKVCQPRVMSQPVVYDKPFWNLGGASSETQWYWPVERLVGW